nr:transposase (putative), gypsy type [Tanacetum cinerariifolium]
MILNSLAGKIGVYSRFFDFADYLVPLSQFIVDVLDYFQINLSQLSVITAAKVSHFEILCRVHDFVPTVEGSHPTPAEFNADVCNFLADNPTSFRKLLEPFLCFIGISRYYTLDETFIRPSRMMRIRVGVLYVRLLVCFFVTVSDLFLFYVKMDLFAFFRHADPIKVKIGGGKPERGNQDNVIQEENTDAVNEDDVDAMAAASLGRRVMFFSFVRTLNVEVGIRAAATVPFVTSFVTLTPEHEGGDYKDSVTGPNMWTQKSVERSFVLDLAILTKVVVTMVVVDASAPVPRTGHELGAGQVRPSIFSDSASPTIVDVDIAGPSQPAEICQGVIDHLAPPGRGWRSDVPCSLQLSCDDLSVKDSTLKCEKDKLSNQVSVLEADCSGMALHMDEEFYPRLLTTIAGRRWILSCGVKLAVVKCLHSLEYMAALGKVRGRAIDKGMQDDLVAGIEHEKAKRSPDAISAYNPSVKDNYVATINALRTVDFPLLAQLKSLRDSSMMDVMDLLCLEGPATKASGTSQLQPSLEQLMVPIHQLEDQAIIGETSLSFSLEVAHNRVQRLRGDASSHRLSLKDVIVLLVEPLSTKGLVGEASTSEVLATTTALSTTFSQVYPVPPTPSIDAPVFPKIVFEHEELDTTPEHDLAP